MLLKFNYQRKQQLWLVLNQNLHGEWIQFQQKIKFIYKNQILKNKTIVDFGTYNEVSEKIVNMFGKSVKFRYQQINDSKTSSLMQFQMNSLEKKQYQQFKFKHHKFQKFQHSVITIEDNEYLQFDNILSQQSSQIEDISINQSNNYDNENSFLTNQTYQRFAQQFIKNPFLCFGITLLFTSISHVGGMFYMRWIEYQQIGGILLLIIIISRIIASIVLFLFIFRAANLLHSEMLSHVIQASPITVESIESGKLLNRFSNDIGSVDSSLFSTFLESIDAFIRFFGTLIYIIIVLPYLFIQGIALIALYSLLVIFSKKVLLESKRLDLQQKGPIFTFLLTTIQGIMNIRVYRQNKDFQNKFQKICNNYAKAKFNFLCIFRTASFYFELIATCSAISGIYLALQSDIKNELLGQVKYFIQFIQQTLIYLVFQTQYIQITYRQLLSTSNVMNSTARCFLCADIPAELSTNLKLRQIPLNRSKTTPILNETEEQTLLIDTINWIQKGEIIFDNVHFKFQENTSSIIKGITCKILPAEKFAIVGKTGSGKTALIQTLFKLGIMENQLDDLTKGCIKIDGIDIQQISPKLLRKNLSILPQKPFIFARNFRENIDPLNQFSDSEIFEVLKDLELHNLIFNLKNQLNSQFMEVIKYLSYGQQYLIGLARIFLSRNKIIIMDEATSNLDLKTDEIVQKFLRKKFTHNTIITIAHRLLSIADYDKVAVIHEGQIIEFGRPFKLLTLNDDDQMITRNSAFAQMVKHSGELMAQIIFEIAREKHIKKIKGFLKR